VVIASVLSPQSSALVLLSAIVLAAWLLALATTIANLRSIPRLTPAPPRGRFVSVLVPARNEERVIERSVRAFLAQDYAALEVIVVDDRSTDRTGAILASIDDPRLVVVPGDDTPEGWLGKPWALQQAAQRARGEVLLFVDADVIYAPGGVSAAVAFLEDSGAAMLSLFPHFELRGFWEIAAMPQLPLTGFTYLPTFAGERRQSARLAIGGGPGNLVRRADYEAIGGHEPLRDAVVDDVALARRMRRSGRRTLLVRADDFVSLRMYHGAREIIDGFTKNTFGVFGRSYVAALGSTVLMLVFHILPYVRACFGDPLAMAAVVVISLTRAVLFRALRYPLWAALLLHPFMIAIWAWIFVRSIWRTGIRRELHWRGRKYDASSTRFGHER
jgi:chlorobactene glucosyltransferase